MSVGQPAHELRFLLHGTRTTETVPFTCPPNLNQASAGAIYFNGHLLLLEHVEFEANTASDAAAPQALFSHARTSQSNQELPQRETHFAKEGIEAAVVKRFLF